MAAQEGMINVHVTTTAELYESWSVSLEVPQTMRIYDFRKLLTSPPHDLEIASSVRFTQRRHASLRILTEKDFVSPFMALQNYTPKYKSSKSRSVEAAPLKELVVEAANLKYITVNISTTEDGYESWCLLADVLNTTTVRALKELLTRAPYNLPINDSQKILYRLGDDADENYRGNLASMHDHEIVKSKLVLLGFVPHKKRESSIKHGRREWFLDMKATIEAHESLPPLVRRSMSWPRTLDFGRMVMVETGNLKMKEYTIENPFVVWILQATELVEGFLVDNNYFSEASDVPTQIYIMGHKLRDFKRCTAERPHTGYSEIITFSYNDRTALAESRKPDLVVLFNVEFSSTRANGRPMQIPQRVLEAGKGALTLISLRFRMWDENIKTLDKSLGQELLFPPIRNRLSYLAGDKHADYDDNGWIVGLRSLQALPEVLKLDVRPPFPESRGPENKLVAMFWGIVDLKYDPHLPMFERIKVLETGDGQSSKFSHHGEEIPKRFRARHRLEASGIGLHSVVANNKKVTHDDIVRAGYEHLVPKQMCLLREYDAGLADRIIEGLDCAHGDIVILKLCNRARAAGVIPVPTDELDEVLEELLQVPEDMEAWFKRKAARGTQETIQVPWGSYEEECRHWWCNECPFFVVERCCRSMLMPSDVDTKLYDGTLRVAFALRRKTNQKDNGSNREIRPEDQLEIEWLGGYWKLPKEDTNSSKLRERIISAARTKGTQAACLADLHEIYAGLGYVVQTLFRLDEPKETLWKRYEYNPVIAAYLTARLSVTFRDLSHGRQTMEMAETLLSEVEDGFPKRCIKSYMHRGRGVFDAIQPPGCWELALKHFSRSVDVMPSNATAWYLKGMALLELDRVEEAVEPMRRALLLDLDFKAPYVNLAVAWLRLQRWDDVIDISEALLLRFPDSPQSHYHIAVSCFMKSQDLHILALGDSKHLSEKEAAAYEELRERAQQAMNLARSGEEGQRLQYREPVLSPWLKEDNQIVNMLRPCFSLLAKTDVFQLKSRNPPITMPANAGWRFFGWRI